MGEGNPKPQTSGFPPPLTPPRKGEGNPSALSQRSRVIDLLFRHRGSQSR
jgi:hypothetical protein